MSKQDRFIARVISSHRRHSFVQRDDGNVFEATRKGKKNDVVVGDFVQCEAISPTQVAIEEILPRKTLLYRSDEFRTKPLAANINQVAVVFATRPTFNKLFLWKAILAATAAGIDCLLIRNKNDISEDEASVRPIIDQLRQLGSRVIEVSATEYPQKTIEILNPLLIGKITLLIGQSGMGKSTILNLLVENADQKTQEYSQALNLGKQTTTATRWFDFKDGALVDSPGFQSFGLSHLELEDIMASMPEIRTRLGQCRFANCKHLQEPGCAIKKAVEDGLIDPARYAFYCELAERKLSESNRYS